MWREGKIAKVVMARRLATQHVLDDAQGMGLQAAENVRFARGRVDFTRVCNRTLIIDWASRTPVKRRVRLVITMEIVIEEMLGSD
jgi:hypothetical protein